MNKTELIASVAQNANITKKDAERIVNAGHDQELFAQQIFF